VIVPVYNGEDVLEACLESITTQENAVIGEDYSVLVIDDGSTDRTVEIASRFPVELISLEKNCGRTAARLTGVQNARAERLLFVDSRVTIPPNLLALLHQFDSYPAVLGVAETKKGAGALSFFDTILFLIRRKYYGRENHPMTGEGKFLTPGNFKRTPKGTTLTLIDRELFVKCSPMRSGKDVSDDTILFHNLVFREKVSVLISPGIKFKYNPARRFWPFLVGLYERGLKFGDFYLTNGGYFQTHFRILMVLALAFFAAIFLLPAHISSVLLWVLWGLYLFLCIWLSETVLDFPILFLGLPVVLFVFGAGVMRFWIKSLLR